MKLVCLQENLVRGLAAVSHAVATRGSLPVLSNILLKTDRGRLRLAATNLETGIVTWVGAKVEKDGELTVPARLLAELAASLGPGRVALAAENQILAVRAERVFSRLNGISAEEFPTFPPVPKKPLLEIGGQLLAKAVPAVTFAAATDEGRSVLTGVLFRLGEGKLTLVGVDGFRLSEKVLEVKVKLEKPLAVVIPAKTLNEVARLMLGKEETIRVFLPEGENQIIFRGQEVEIFSRLLEGTFPDYKKIIPGGFATAAKFSRDSLVRSIRLAAIFAGDSANIVKLKFETSKGRLILSANTAEVGENETFLEGQIEGEETEVAFNAKYLLDCLTHLEGEEVSFRVNGPLGPGLVRPVGDKSYLHLIMPVRIQS